MVRSFSCYTPAAARYDTKRKKGQSNTVDETLGGRRLPASFYRLEQAQPREVNLL